MAAKDTKAIYWDSDPPAESKLRQLKILVEKPTYENINPKLININETICANTRSDGLLNPAFVDKYTHDMLAGNVFPAIVVHTVSLDGATTLYEILNGLHRYKAALAAKLPHVRCLILPSLDDREAHYARLALNQTIGHCEKAEDVAARAAQHILDHADTRSVAQIAIELSVSPETLKSHLAAEKVRRQAQASDIDLSHTSKASLEALSCIKDDDVRMKAAAAVVESKGVSAANVRALVSEVNQLPKAKADKAIARFEVRFPPTPATNGASVRKDDDHSDTANSPRPSQRSTIQDNVMRSAVQHLSHLKKISTLSIFDELPRREEYIRILHQIRNTQNELIAKLTETASQED